MTSSMDANVCASAIESPNTLSGAPGHKSCGGGAPSCRPLNDRPEHMIATVPFIDVQEKLWRRPCVGGCSPPCNGTRQDVSLSRKNRSQRVKLKASFASNDSTG